MSKPDEGSSEGPNYKGHEGETSEDDSGPSDLWVVGILSPLFLLVVIPSMTLFEPHIPFSLFTATVGVTFPISGLSMIIDARNIGVRRVRRIAGMAIVSLVSAVVIPLAIFGYIKSASEETAADSGALVVGYGIYGVFITGIVGSIALAAVVWYAVARQSALNRMRTDTEPSRS